MKRIIVLLLLSCLCFVSTSWASTEPKSFGYLDAQKSTTFVPIQFLSGVGVNVNWDSAEQRVDMTYEQTKISMYIGKRLASVNEEQVELTDLPYIAQGVKYVPLRFVTDTLKMKQEWKGDTSSVSVTLDEQTAELPVISQALNPNNSKPIVSESKTFKVGSKSFKTQVVTISLMHPKIRLDVALAHDEIGRVDDLKNIANKNGAAVAINGSFFDAYTKSDIKIPYGNVVSGGEQRKKDLSDRRTIFTFDKNNLVKLISGTYYKEQFNNIKIEGGVQVGPRLVKDGKVELNVVAEGFKDPKILTGGGARSALGITRDHKLILLTIGGATIPQLAAIMKQAGAYQAMNLDGGASSGLYVDGKYLTTPGRQISNAIIVKYEK
ncbi:phosphodiester glycosidase family protein [Cohnella sp. WQ 127256]|uniref:phosphodiester glycosidase family protein n=1 Tax=Cohnella sp. WQ 127256 TaxID=2938790 RepID=UPI0021190D61|nr:phosphodiester glycosidase family protein [Cohnella sp. WQ 127256]